MKLKPILFSTPMVQAILEGRKTQTRRIIKPQPNGDPCGICTGSTDSKNIGAYGFAKDEELTAIIKCPYGQIGDVLWVKETWQKTTWLHPSHDEYGYIYRASESGKEWESNDEGWKWKPSIFMPFEAARIFLKVTNIRVERLQDISENNAQAEGVKSVLHWAQKTPFFEDYTYYSKKPMSENGGFFNPINSFQSLWTSINGIDSWNANPWVWVVEFERIEQPEL